MAGNGQFGRLTKSAGFRIAGTHTSTREPARSGKKKPQPRTVGVLLLVVGGGSTPHQTTVESTRYRRSGTLRSLACWFRGQFNSRNGNRTRVRHHDQKHTHLHPLRRNAAAVRRIVPSITALPAVNNLRMRRLWLMISA